ncbi:hypothetical protein F2Q68_00045005 [Brassica cretica]|uniref:Uncharacterized protein n=1 Tax=Brassica cretica TaxID=69181 RepID=A0A8S9LTE7_BRACR|nr:hypothetical protein F2Q68_00045005 [Brassica cretica]
MAKSAALLLHPLLKLLFLPLKYLHLRRTLCLRAAALTGSGKLGILLDRRFDRDVLRFRDLFWPPLASIGLSSIEERDFSGGGLRVCLVLTLSPKEFPCLSNIFWNEMLAEFTPPELYEVDLLADFTETKWKAKKNEDVACNLARGKPGEQMSINKEGVVADSCC